MYCTIEDLEQRIDSGILKRFSNNDKDNPANILETNVSELIEDASSLIDLNLISGGYTLPITNTIALSFFRRICVDIVSKYLCDRKNKVLDSVNKNYEKALKMLEDIKNGELEIGETTSKISSQSVQYEDRDFTKNDKLYWY